MEWIAALMIFFTDRPPVVMTAKHDPFQTEQECKDWVTFTEPKTGEFIAALIDRGAPIKGHAGVCYQPADDTPKNPT